MGRSKIPQLHCLHPVCKNPELLLKGIKKNCDNIDILTKCHDLLEKIVCDPVTQPCVDKKCTSCPSLEWRLLMIVKELIIIHGKKTSIIKKFFVKYLVRKFTPWLNCKLTIHVSTIIKNNEEGVHSSRNWKRLWIVAVNPVVWDLYK